jgi:hypothetical protein
MNWAEREATAAVRAYQQAVRNQNREQALMHRRQRAMSTVEHHRIRTAFKTAQLLKRYQKMMNAVANYEARRTHRLGQMPNGSIVLLKMTGA